jgi:DNA adenine methylase
MGINNKQYPNQVPFLKWAGGKRWLTKGYPHLFDIDCDRYIEPFLGSGAVFFHLRPACAVLADSNSFLIETYQALRDEWRAVRKALEVHQRLHTKQYYYALRGKRLKKPSARAAQFIYLNRTCWNGLFRVNRNGKFNVPIGTKTSVLLDADDFEAVSVLLQRAELLCSDFESVIDMSRAGDFLFVDPPYTVKHDNNGFIKYNEKLFSWDDQIRLRDTLVRAKQRGARIVLTNANHKSLKEIYREHFEIEVVQRNSVLSADSQYRGVVGELIIKG